MLEQNARVDKRCLSVVHQASMEELVAQKRDAAQAASMTAAELRTESVGQRSAYLKQILPSTR